MYNQLYLAEILCSAHKTFMSFAWISKQTAIISLYSINLSDFITEAECFLRGTSWVFKSDRYSFVLKRLTFRQTTQTCAVQYLHDLPLT